MNTEILKSKIIIEQELEDFIKRNHINISTFYHIDEYFAHNMVFYSYINEFFIKYKDINKSFNQSFLSEDDLRKFLLKEISYYFNYFEECTDIELILKRKLLTKNEILGQFYSNYNDRLVILINDEKLSEIELIKFKSMINRKNYINYKLEEFEKKYNKEEIRNLYLDNKFQKKNFCFPLK